ncbi:hypothetical protein WN943_017193 [Citrus x changshan-huyou]
MEKDRKLLQDVTWAWRVNLSKIGCNQSPVNVLKRELLIKRFCTQFIGKSIPNMEQGQLLNVGYLLPGCT